MKSQFNQKLIKHLQHLLHIDPERVKYLLLEIDYHHLLKQPEVKVLFDGTELTVQHIESRTAAYQKLRESWNKSKAVKELKADLKELKAIFLKIFSFWFYNTNLQQHKNIKHQSLLIIIETKLKLKLKLAIIKWNSNTYNQHYHPYQQNNFLTLKSFLNSESLFKFSCSSIGFSLYE